MFKFHIQGFCICVLEKDMLRVLMLNSSVRNRRVVPHHLPSLYAKGDAVSRYSLRRLPSVAGRWLPSQTDERLTGWDLTGVAASIGSGTAPAKSSSVGLTKGRNYPVGRPLNWKSLDWVLNASKFLPSGVLRERFKMLGPDTTAIVEIRGGQIQGGDPVGSGDTHWIWRVHPRYEQAFTSTLDVVFEEPPSVTCADADGHSCGEVVFHPNSEAWLINEAPERARGMESMTDTAAALEATQTGAPFPPASDDCLLYVEAFDADEGEKSQIDVQAVKPFATTGLIFSTAQCELLLVEER